MLYIRADANEHIASGHIMRCLSIAEALREIGEESTFVVADEQAAFLLEEKGYPYLCLHTDWSDKEGELPGLLRLIEEHHIKTLLVDSYQVTENYLRELKQRVTLCYIDDMDIAPELVDVLICYSITYENMRYGQGYQGDTKLLLGPAYSPLRREFSGRIVPANERAGNVFLTTGGADTYGVSAAFLEACLRHDALSGFEYHVIVGGFYDASLKNRLYELQRQASSIHLYENIRTMAEVMSGCDIAVSAGGSTLLELCACGVPTVCFTYADNQMGSAACFHKKAILQYVGDARENHEGVSIVVERLRDAVWQLADDCKARKEAGKKMQQLIDGSGAMRIARELQHLTGLEID